MNISKECHKDIIDLVEEYINEISKEQYYRWKARY